MQETKPVEQLNKKEQRALSQQEKETQKKSTTKTTGIKRVTKRGIIMTLIILSISSLIWYVVATRPLISKEEIISQNGFHWHPELIIYVKGEKQEIPPNIGIGAIHQPIHTHNDSNKGIIHFEFQGLVQKQDITLGQFFKNWNKDIRSFGSNIKMTVNGKENIEYENYIMQDNDKIELRYE